MKFIYLKAGEKAKVVDFDGKVIGYEMLKEYLPFTLTMVTRKIGEKDFCNMLMSIQGTFISTLFANAQFEKKEDIIAFGKMIGAVQAIKVRKDN